MKIMRTLVKRFAMAVLTAVLPVTFAACGGGVYVETPVAVVVPSVALLDLVLTRTAPQTIQLDWSFDSAARSYAVTRDGYSLAQTPGEILVDTSVVFGYRYCYNVVGLDALGHVISQSMNACITLY